MPENNFEKQVQQKMDELQLRPSAEVWQEVEQRIRREKKRRGMILFILLALLLAGGAGWWMITGSKTKSGTQTIAETKNTSNDSKLTTPEKKNNETEKSTVEKIENNQDDKKETIKNNTENSTVAEEKVGTGNKASVPVLRKTSNDETSATATLITGKINKKQKVSKPVTTELLETDAVATGGNKTDVPATLEEIVTTTNVNGQVADSAAKKDITTNNIIPGIELVKDRATQNDIASNTTTAKNNPYPIVSDSSVTRQTETAAKKDFIKIKKSKWEIGFSAVVGVSNKAKAFSVFGSMNKSLSDYSGQITGSPSQLPPTTRPIPYLSPADPEKGNFWQVGMHARRKFSAKIGLSVGLNFSSYSTIQQTGMFADSRLVLNSSIPAGGYYTSGTTGTLHTNHYYFLQLPVAFHWQLNKGNKIPIIWQNGFSTGLFLGGDALVYNSQSNVFYKDNKSFNKIQLSYQSGVYAKLFNKSKHPLTAGVLINYHLSKLQNTNIYGGNHLSSFGFQLGWLLKK